LIIFLLLVFGLYRFNYQFAQNDPEGMGIAPQWIGSRLTVLEGKNPYSSETLDRIQRFVYDGRLARSYENPYLFVYPYYAIAVFSPTAYFADYREARAIWITILGVAMVGVAFASLELTRWKPSRVVMGAYVLFALANYHAIRAVYNGNLAILTTLCLILAFLNIQKGRDVSAGIFLGLATIKPQMVILLWVFVLLWAVSRRRKRLVFSMMITPIILLIVSSRFQPGWFNQYIAQISEYVRVEGVMSLGGILNQWQPGFGGILRWVITTIFAIVLMVEWWNALGKDERRFLWTAGLTLTITNLIGIPTSTSNYVIMIPVLTLVFSVWEQRRGIFGRNLVLACILGLLAGLWWLYLQTAGDGPGFDQSRVMFLPLPFFLLFMLYWIRHWAFGSFRLQVEELESLKKLW
jgi:hypothetical protein